LFRRIGGTARSAHSGQTRAALAAEFQGGRVLVLAARALHGGGLEAMDEQV